MASSLNEERLEETNPEATGGGDESLERGMELAVYNAAKTGNVDALSAYKERLHHIFTPTKNTVLHIYIACAAAGTETPYKQVTGSAIVVEKMLEMCPPMLRQTNQNGDTALHIAARYGRISIVNKILEISKKDLVGGEAWPRIISETNKGGDTALHEAVRFNHFDVVKILTREDDHQQNLHSVNGAGETPLYLAAERGYRNLVSLILKSCIDPAYQGPNNRTALHAAVIRNDIGTTKELLGYINPLTKDEQGCTPLHLAASLGHTAVVKLLLKKDRSAAYVRDKDKKWTPFHYAAHKGHMFTIRQLISDCPDCCEIVDSKSRNVLHCGIIAHKENAMLKCVTEDPWLCHILLNGKDDKGDAPLHYIVKSRSFLSMFGSDARVDKMAFNKANQSALDIIRQSKRTLLDPLIQGQLVKKLRRNGARPGCRIVRSQEIKVKDDENKYSKLVDSHLVVATLIATVSFAAGITMPGGYQSDRGSSDQGSAVLSQTRAFQAFVIANTIAMALSSSSVLLHLYSLRFFKQRGYSKAYAMLYLLTMWALFAMMIAFISGTYAVLGNCSWLRVTACVLGCVLIYGLMDFMARDDRGTLTSLSLLFCMLVIDIFRGIGKVLRIICYIFLWLVSLSKHIPGNSLSSQPHSEMC